MKEHTIGALRHRLDIEVLSAVNDGAGGASLIWQKQGELWAKITPISASETNAGDRISGIVSHEIIVRYQTSIAPEMRLRSEERVFHILGVRDEGERRRWLILSCEERDL